MSNSPLPLPVKLVIIEGILLYLFGFGFEMATKIYDPPNRGFFCNDLSIRLHKKESTVPLSWLLVFIYSCGFLPVTFVEAYRLLKYDPGRFYSQYERLRGKGMRLVIRIVIFVGWFHVAVISNWILTSTAKFSAGRPRPYYLEACKPNVDLQSCFNSPVYFDESTYNCTETNIRMIRESRLSFFSGHTSLATAAAVFAVLYIQARLVGKIASRIGPILLQVALLSAALFAGLSRIVDQQHHPEDVVVGMIVGMTVSVVVANFCARLFDEREEDQYDEKQPVICKPSSL
ncbi:hypothetical protein FO519_009878 [Halicephalobus sp. NKZ332]|nr:hypothetical protein FO519_009878 [Halicephalobus sp. NKZ332]